MAIVMVAISIYTCILYAALQSAPSSTMTSNGYSTASSSITEPSSTMTSNGYSMASSSTTAGGSDSSSTALAISPTPTISFTLIGSPTPVGSPILSVNITTESPSDTTETIPSDDEGTLMCKIYIQ